MSGEPTEVQDDSVDPADALGLHDRGYLMLLLVVALLGIPLSAAAFGFLAAVHELEHLVWETWPHDLGYAELPAWWPILTVGVAGVLVALTVKYLPGHGGHIPVAGLGGGGRRRTRCRVSCLRPPPAWWAARCSDPRRR